MISVLLHFKAEESVNCLFIFHDCGQIEVCLQSMFTGNFSFWPGRFQAWRYDLDSCVVRLGQLIVGSYSDSNNKSSAFLIVMSVDVIHLSFSFSLKFICCRSKWVLTGEYIFFVYTFRPIYLYIHTHPEFWLAVD